MGVNNFSSDSIPFEDFQNLQIWLMRVKRESYNRGLEDAASIVLKNLTRDKYVVIEEIVNEIRKLKY